jgi:hypothetical protein
MAALLPPDSALARARRTTVDQHEGAWLCFGLARRYGGVGLPQDWRSARPSGTDTYRVMTSRDLAIDLALEGCVGATIAAAISSEQATIAIEPHASGVLRRLAQDDARHAEATWLALGWAIDVLDADARASVAAAFSGVSTSASVGCWLAHVAGAGHDPIDERAWQNHGRLTGEEVMKTTRTCLRDIVVPCARALFEAHGLAMEVARV